MLRLSLPLMLFFIASSPRLAACGTTLHALSKTAWEKAMKKSSAFEKMVMQKNKSKGSCGDHKAMSNRFLVTINILGSAGPIRFVVNERDLVSGVIDTALKSYAREGRFPALGFDASNFLLYCANAGFDALNPLEPIGSYGVRNFVLCKKQVCSSKTEPQSELIPQKSSGGWKAWLKKSKSFGLKILSH